jgi:hypothetical protein
MPSAAATFPRVTAVQARAVAHPDYRRIFSDVALGLGSMTAMAALAGTATVTAAWMVASSFAHDPDLRPAAPMGLDMARLPKPHRHLASAADRFGSALAAANPVYAPPLMRTAELAPSGNVAWASNPVPMPMPKPMPPPASHLPRQRTAALEKTIPLPRPRPAEMSHSPVTHKTTPATEAPRLARDLSVLPTPRPVDNSQTTEPELARISAPRAAAPTIASIISASRAANVRPPPSRHQLDRLSPPVAAPPPRLARGLTVRPTPRPVDNSQTTEGELARISAPRMAPPTIASIISASRAADVLQPPRRHEPDRLSPPVAAPPPRLARGLTVRPTPRPVDNSQTTEPELARISAPRTAAAPAIASPIAADVLQPPTQHELDRLSPPVAAPQTTSSIPERAEATSVSRPRHRGAQFAYNNPDLPSGPDSHTAIYDIVAHTVYLPNGERLEAHSGLGRLLDDPRYVSEKGRGATPPNVYNLTLRHPLFHGVEAIRLNPVADAKMYGRDGILAHTYMLGPSGQSFGCVSFKDYAEFLHAFLRGEIDKLVVVPHLRTAPWAARARRADGKRYAFNTQ